MTTEDNDDNDFEPDYRFTLANERTFLAWERTALGLLAAAVAIVQFVPHDRGHCRPAGVRRTGVGDHRRPDRAGVVGGPGRLSEPSNTTKTPHPHGGPRTRACASVATRCHIADGTPPIKRAASIPRSTAFSMN